MTSTCKPVLPLSLALLCLCAGASRAEQSAFSFTEPSAGSPSAAGTDGFEFRPRVDIVVTSLGYYDQGRDGLSLRHTVAIYDTASRLKLAWVTLGGNKQGTLSGAFRYRAIKPRRLKAGRSYTIAGYHPGNANRDLDLAVSRSAQPDVAPEIGYGTYRMRMGPSLQFPTITSQGSFFGPNFRFRAASEPRSVKTIITRNGVVTYTKSVPVADQK